MLNAEKLATNQTYDPFWYLWPSLVMLQIYHFLEFTQGQIQIVYYSISIMGLLWQNMILWYGIIAICLRGYKINKL